MFSVLTCARKWALSGQFTGPFGDSFSISGQQVGNFGTLYWAISGQKKCPERAHFDEKCPEKAQYRKGIFPRVCIRKHLTDMFQVYHEKVQYMKQTH